MSSSLLHARNASFAYAGRFVLQNVSFDAGPGEFIAVIGRNGSGKSTLLNLLAGILEPSAGRVFLQGIPLSDHSPRQRAQLLCHLPQTTPSGMGFTVEQVVLMGRYSGAESWFESDEDVRACEAAIERLELQDLRRRRLSALSGGERQRALLAACLAQQAEVLLLDEPVACLDIDHQLNVMALLQRECAAGRLVMAVLHDLNLALRFCTRLMLMSECTIHADLSVRDAVSRSDWLERLSRQLRLETDGGSLWWVRFS
jgi:iron complex transport system ATP-binding protein